ncbi:hypothetical protein F5Y17DRAFT_470454 [Xylariaceae sp. FL0594]|nr:hypothetical protein F5Y17DRAFT_470454 [Xylariaceae sp. FL0594]
MARPDPSEAQAGRVGRGHSPSPPAAPAFPVRAVSASTPTATQTSASSSRQPSMTTPYAVPLTTTFVPPDSCNTGQLSQLSSPGYFIWLNEPVPVPGTTVSDCYPSEFLQYYSTYHPDATKVGSRVPMMSPLVCPFAWQVVYEQDDYQACCPSEYKLALPTTSLLDSKRPAYGGTCYSDWTLSQTAFVDAYGSTSLMGQQLAVASSTPFQAYAHVIDGIAMASSSSQTSSTSLPPASSSVPAETSKSNQQVTLTGGAIAGIVIGVLAALGLLAIAGFVLARRRRRRMASIPPVPPPKDPRDDVDMSTMRSPTATELSINTPSPKPFKPSHTAVSEMAAGESHIHELEAGGIPAEKP